MCFKMQYAGTVADKNFLWILEIAFFFFFFLQLLQVF